MRKISQDFWILYSLVYFASATNVIHWHVNLIVLFFSKKETVDDPKRCIYSLCLTDCMYIMCEFPHIYIENVIILLIFSTIQNIFRFKWMASMKLLQYELKSEVVSAVWL